MNAFKRKPRLWISAGIGAVVLLTTVAFGTPEASTPKKGANLRENSYYYGAFNRRDPFRSLIEGMFVRDAMMDLIDLTNVELVGVVKGELDRFALLEDSKGFTYIMRVGDKVRSGTVVSIAEKTMTARINTFGQTSKFTLHMVERQGDKR